jgi:hypothetical protein
MPKRSLILAMVGELEEFEIAMMGDHHGDFESF